MSVVRRVGILFLGTFVHLYRVEPFQQTPVGESWLEIPNGARTVPFKVGH